MATLEELEARIAALESRASGIDLVALSDLARGHQRMEPTMVVRAAVTVMQAGESATVPGMNYVLGPWVPDSAQNVEVRKCVLFAGDVNVSLLKVGKPQFECRSRAAYAQMQMPHGTDVEVVRSLGDAYLRLRGFVLLNTIEEYEAAVAQITPR